MTLAGEGFLKCAFAPPDFNSDAGRGIPDDFQGKVLTRKDVLTTSLSYGAGQDVYILVAPTPGISYWYASVANGASLSGTAFRPNPYPGYRSLFGDTGLERANNVTSFRYASTCVGLYPTSNMQQFAGSISVWKFPMELINQIVGVGTPVVGQPCWVLNGTDNFSGIGYENYTDSFIKGMYSQSVCNEPDFEFRPIIEEIGAIPSGVITATQAGMFCTFATSQPAAGQLCGIVGMGTMDCILIKVATPVGATNSAVLKTWACVEYRPNTNSALYSYAHDSPAPDLMALAAYREIAKNVPIAVPCSQNEGFWKRVLTILRGGLSLTSKIPGPIGMTATGVSGIMDMMTGLAT
ncbi:capsid protein [Hubei unio douglasiae virus 1]|uniref:capsid protein n=1 Tax=Hubei unio douglasiae virus 1 TaxID=1923321 RepID=UPI00090B4191|nr:capsid protein [Hubei unio douglasiae virus 1]APG76489.1 capsid protein [Hubei unio douglasiae virus 1]